MDCCFRAISNTFEVLVKNLNNQQLDTPYRPEGWTVRQVIHHISDSHHIVTHVLNGQ